MVICFLYFADRRTKQNLSDFKSTSCLTPLSYGILYISLGISIACYAVDLFTAANLLFFNRWSGQVKPAIPFNVSRWIFAVCIVLSWILLVYRWVRAVRAMRSGIVAASYLDPLAVMLQSIRVGKTGRGWKRFLVFAELTKGRKGAEYVALFTYFSFEGKIQPLGLVFQLIICSMATHHLCWRAATSYQCVDTVFRHGSQSSAGRRTCSEPGPYTDRAIFCQY